MATCKRGEPVTLDWLRSNCIVDEDTGCWIWQRGRNEKGYGLIWRKECTGYAHRVAFKLAGGIIPPGQCVLHSCDRPACCSPEHLSAGTQLQNIEDMKVKGRAARGEKNGSSKLTPEEIQLIRTGPGNQYEKAREFGVSQASISLIMTSKRWAHVAA